MKFFNSCLSVYEAGVFALAATDYMDDALELEAEAKAQFAKEAAWADEWRQYVASFEPKA